MPFQAPPSTDFLTCSVCKKEYSWARLPVTLGCCHTICKLCLSKLHGDCCPFDKVSIRWTVDSLPVNYAILRLVCSITQTLPPKSQLLSSYVNTSGLSAEDFALYIKASDCIEQVALFLKPSSTEFGAGIWPDNTGSRQSLSRQMQKRVATLINCQILEDRGRVCAVKCCRSLVERCVLELIVRHQSHQYLSSSLWTSLRAKGCQFLGPAVQEEVLKLILLALEDGSALSRKVIVMFVVQRLESRFPQITKTSVGHVIQILYRGSCFTVIKREGASALMQLKEEYRIYEHLRREHDTQIVQIALEAGLRITPEQWSSLLHGDTVHNCYIQSIIDKQQTAISLHHSIQDLMFTVQKTGDPYNISGLKPHLAFLADLEKACSDVKDFSMEDVLRATNSVFAVLDTFVKFIRSSTTLKTGGSSLMEEKSASVILGFSEENETHTFGKEERTDKEKIRRRNSYSSEPCTDGAALDKTKVQMQHSLSSLDQKFHNQCSVTDCIKN